MWIKYKMPSNTHSYADSFLFFIFKSVCNRKLNIKTQNKYQIAFSAISSDLTFLKFNTFVSYLYTCKLSNII